MTAHGASVFKTRSCRKIYHRNAGCKTSSAKLACRDTSGDKSYSDSDQWFFSTMQTTAKTQTAICLFAATFFTVAPVKADDWSSYQHDPAHTGRSSAVIDPNALTLAWSAPAGYSTPLVVGNSVYATKNAGGSGGLTTVSSFSLSTGLTLWSFNGPSFVYPSQAAVGGGFVVFQGHNTLTSTNDLYVLDATLGVLRYTVRLSQGYGSLMPTVVEDPVTGVVTAYVIEGYYLRAVTLGLASGTIQWTQIGSFGGDSIPTIVGNSVIIAGPGQYYAFDKDTGAPNHFHQGDVSGGGGCTIAYDATRSEFYVLEQYDTRTRALSAYQYVSNDDIRLLWQQVDNSFYDGSSVAIGANGNVYWVARSNIRELDPSNGQILRSVSGTFDTDSTPALSQGLLWAVGSGQVLAYDLNSFELLGGFKGGGVDSRYPSPSVLVDGYLLIDQPALNTSTKPSFDVYAQSQPMPTPTAPPIPPLYQPPLRRLPRP